MILAIFGGTGRTGQILLQKALETGHTVRVLARNPAKLAVQHERLSVVSGSVLEAACVERVVADADAVLSVLGPSSNKPVFEVSRGMEHILAAMHAHGVRRLVLSTGAGVGDPEDKPGLFHRAVNLLLHATAKNVYEDMRQTVERVRASSLDWTVVRVPMLTDGPASGQVRVGMVGKGMGPRISRADLAAFMLAQLASDEYVRRAPAISSR